MYTFLDLQNQVKRSSTRDQGGTQFDQWTKDTINYALFTLSRECAWKVLRRDTIFETLGNFTTGTVTTTADSKTLTFTTSDLITNGIQIGRRIAIDGVQGSFVIATITGENSATVTDAIPTAVTDATFTIFGQEEYNFPIQTGRVRLMWHEQFDYPYQMNFITDMDFINSQPSYGYSDIPTHYREWGSDMTINQPRQPSVIRIASSSSSDLAISVTVFGIVSGYPDYEIISTDASNGTTPVSGTKSFSSIERVIKGATSLGRITVDADSAATTIAVFPVGDTMGGVEYKKVQLYPLPSTVFPINVLYYKDPARLVNDNDIHELGHDFDDAIVLLAVARIKYDQSLNDDGDKFFALYTKQLNTLRRKNADNLAWIPTQKRPSESRPTSGRIHNNLLYSQLGSAYGPSSRF